MTLPLLLLWWLLTNAWQPGYTPESLYLYYLVRQFLYPLLPGLALFFLLERRVVRESGYVVVVAMSVFLGGVYFVQSIVDVLRITNYYSPYVVFLLPTLRMALMLAVPVFVGAFSRESRPVRVLWLIAVVLLPAVFAGIPLLYHLRYVLLSHVLTPAAAALGIALHLVVMQQYYPQRSRAWTFRGEKKPKTVGTGDEDEVETPGAPDTATVLWDDTNS
ncbi:MAG: hypothetical protein ACLFRR_05645 [Spirochaetaceae bacterium]